MNPSKAVDRLENRIVDLEYDLDDVRDALKNGHIGSYDEDGSFISIDEALDDAEFDFVGVSTFLAALPKCEERAEMVRRLYNVRCRLVRLFRSQNKVSFTGFLKGTENVSRPKK